MKMKYETPQVKYELLNSKDVMMSSAELNADKENIYVANGDLFNGGGSGGPVIFIPDL